MQRELKLTGKCTTCKQEWELTPAQEEEARGFGVAFSPCCGVVATIEHASTRPWKRYTPVVGACGPNAGHHGAHRIHRIDYEERADGEFVRYDELKKQRTEIEQRAAAATVLRVLDKDMTLDNLRALGDKELARLESLLNHWHQLAISERQRRSSKLVGERL